MPAKACDRSYLSLLGVTALPGGQYSLDVRFCTGGGQTGSVLGADQNTATFAFFLSSGAQFASYPSQLISPQTGYTYIDSAFGTDTLVYYSEHLFTGPYEPWACIFNCGPLQDVCYDITIVTTGLPDSLWLRGMEANGNLAAGCDNLDMTVYPSGLGCNIQLAPTVTQTVCAGSTGSIALNPVGGTAPYAYNWSTSATTSSISGLSAGSYSVTVTDNASCIKIQSFTINAPIAYSIELGANKTVYRGYSPLSCATLSPAPTGGITPYAYAWSTGATSSTINVCPTSNTSYTVTVTDARGCILTDNITVNVVDVRCGPSLNKVLVCHNGNTMCVTSSQATTHLGHGDALGSCGSKMASAAANDDVAWEYKVSVYPNPASGNLYLDVQSIAAGTVTLDIYDLQGKRMASYSSLAPDGQSHQAFVLDVSALSSGLYFARVTHTASGMQTLKFTVSK